MVHKSAGTRVGRRLAQLREVDGRSLKGLEAELAARSSRQSDAIPENRWVEGLTASAIQRAEAGKEMSLRTATTLARYYDISLETLQSAGDEDFERQMQARRDLALEAQRYGEALEAVKEWVKAGGASPAASDGWHSLFFNAYAMAAEETYASTGHELAPLDPECDSPSGRDINRGDRFGRLV